MNLTAEPITAGSRFLDAADALLLEAFPPEERLSARELVSLAASGTLDFLALVDEDAPAASDARAPSPKGGTFAGFCAVMLLKNMAYLFFLAICPVLRSKGYGSAALDLVRRRYPGREFTVDFERVDERAENNARRISRRAFYIRNGFKPTGLFLTYLGVDYEVLSTSDTFDERTFREMMSRINEEGFAPRFHREPHAE